ncbi:uncharacterized protein LOC134765406 [Penaeus indicus]|uniref:uncharacterized protein LOC134765406 n=1 Tax=Penaeus indicus TaxID=29960 RepID=UPI00300C1AA9
MEMEQSKSSGCCLVSSLKVSTIVLGSIGLLLWPAAICATTYITFDVVNGNYLQPFPIVMAAIILVGVNIAYIYQTSLIILTLTESKRMSRQVVESVRRNTACLVAFLLVGFAEWVTSVVFYVMEGMDRVEYITLFGCSFSFVWTAVVAAVAGSLTHVAENGSRDEHTPRDHFPLIDYSAEQFETRNEMHHRYKETRSTKPSYARSMPGTWATPVHGRVSPWSSHL